MSWRLFSLSIALIMTPSVCAQERSEAPAPAPTKKHGPATKEERTKIYNSRLGHLLWLRWGEPKYIGLHNLSCTVTIGHDRKLLAFVQKKASEDSSTDKLFEELVLGLELPNISIEPCESLHLEIELQNFPNKTIKSLDSNIGGNKS